MSASIYRLSDYRDEWKEIFYRDDGITEIHVYVNAKTGELEIFQMTDGKGQRSCLSTVDAIAFVEACHTAHNKLVAGK